jgi:serine/threonine protein kinase
MALDPADIAEVSRLLGEALDRAPQDRESWLAALPEPQRRHEAVLRHMLERQEQLGTEKSLGPLPPLRAADSEEAVAHAEDTVGPYRLLREIGRGGMGSVWLAERVDGQLKRQVALKLPRLAWGAGLAERMAREREIGALLEHPSIARLYDAGVDDRGRPFLAHEYVDGQPIDAWCDAQGLGVRERLQLALQVVRAVSYAHGRLVVHRDLKPSNVMVTPSGQAYLLDFGIAKLLNEVVPGQPELTQEQGRVMTPLYASPEQVAGEPITVQADVYSLGVLIYELLTGTLPIAARRTTPGAVEDAILLGNPPLASTRAQHRALARALRGELDAILAKAMKRQPAERYATADALAQDIERHLSGEAVLARPDSRLYRLRKALWRHRVAVGTSAAVVVSLLAGSGVAVVQAQRANNEAERARLVKDFVVQIFDTSGSADGTLLQMPAHELLERGAKLIDSRFAGQPLLQAELYGVLRQMFSNLANYTEAVTYGSRQFETLSAAGAPPTALAQVEIDLASDLANLGRAADAVMRYRHALTMAGHDAALQVRAHAGLSLQIAFVGADHKAQQAEIEAAVQIIAREPVPPMVRAEALIAQGFWADDEAGVDKAAPLFDEAIRLAEATQGPLSRTAMKARTSLGAIYAASSQRQAAMRYYTPALAAMRTLGGPNDVRAAQEEARLAQSLYAGGSGPLSFVEAQAIFERSLAALNAQAWPVPRNILNEVHLLYGSVLSNWGDVTHGYALMSTHAQEYLSANPQGSIAESMRRDLASTASAAGHFHEALALATQQLQWARQVMPRPAATFSSVWLLAGIYENATRYAEAQAVFDEYAALPGGAEMLRSEWAPDTMGLIFPPLIRLRLEAGDIKGALELTQSLDPARHTQMWIRGVWAIRAKALCLAGRAEEGLAMFQRWQPPSRDWYDANPSQAAARAETGLCALRAGHRSLARELSALASAAIAKQPGVAEGFKLPVRELEQKLRGR